MSKILLVIAVTVLVVLLFKSLGRKGLGPARPADGKGVEDMVRCQVCGVNLPRSEALMSQGRFYCCDQHRLEDQSRR